MDRYWVDGVFFFQEFSFVGKDVIIGYNEYIFLRRERMERNDLRLMIQEKEVSLQSRQADISFWLGSLSYRCFFMLEVLRSFIVKIRS